MGVILETRGLGFGYGKTGDPVFEDLDLSVEAGELFCILGPNGIGKSTLLKCLAGIERPTSGHVRLLDKDLASYSRSAAARITAYVPQMHQGAFAFTVFDAVLMGRAPHVGPFSSPSARDRRIAGQAIESLGIGHLAEKPYTEISGGERQLVLFARILAQEPRLLLLDEPTSHLDFGNQIQVLALVQSLAEQGMAVIMTSHFPDHAFLVSHTAAIMREGGFEVQGDPLDVITEDRLSAAYGASVRLVDLDGYGRICVPLLPDANRN
jgi:iron complex transport system ATP-binding protein